MSFWALSNGEDASKTGTEFGVETGGVLIPDNSVVLAMVKDAGIMKDQNFNEFYFVDWSVLKPEPVQGAFIRQKLWIIDADPRAKDPKKKRDTALRMLGAIDANCGGKLSTLKAAPTDEQMKIALVNKQVVIRTKVWEIDGTEGNWVSFVYPKTTPIELKGEVKQKASAPKKEVAADDGWGSTSGGGFANDIDDDIPF